MLTVQCNASNIKDCACSLLRVECTARLLEFSSACFTTVAVALQPKVKTRCCRHHENISYEKHTYLGRHADVHHFFVQGRQPDIKQGTDASVFEQIDRTVMITNDHDNLGRAFRPSRCCSTN